MKITSANIYAVPTGPIKAVILELETDEGIVGLGEAATAYGLGYSASAALLKEMVDRDVIGKDPMRIRQIWDELYDQCFWAKGGGAITFAAISAIEMALWDIKGKYCNVPVYEFFGGKVHDTLHCYANGWNFGEPTAEAWAAAVDKAVNEGFDSFKCYPLAHKRGERLYHVTRRSLNKEEFRLAYDRIAALRKHLGDDKEILVDVSGGLTTDQTIRLGRMYEDLDLGWLEEPADAFHEDAIKKISEHVNIPIAAGERVYTSRGFTHLLDLQAVDIVQPDIGNTGGLMETFKIAAMAEARNIRVAIHNCASTLCTAATVQLSAALSNAINIETYPYHRREPGYVEVLEDGEALEDHIKDSYVTVPDKPGLGVTLAKERLTPYKVGVCGKPKL